MWALLSSLGTCSVFSIFWLFLSEKYDLSGGISEDIACIDEEKVKSRDEENCRVFRTKAMESPVVYEINDDSRLPMPSLDLQPFCGIDSDQNK